MSRFAQFSGWIPAIVVLILVTTTPPFASPDGIEAVAAGACVLTPGADCAQVPMAARDRNHLDGPIRRCLSVIVSLKRH